VLRENTHFPAHFHAPQSRGSLEFRAAIVVSATLELARGKICGNFLCLDLISSLDASQAIAALTPCSAEGRADAAESGVPSVFQRLSMGHPFILFLRYFVTLLRFRAACEEL
jgi:hypothetical protein